MSESADSLEVWDLDCDQFVDRIRVRTSMWIGSRSVTVLEAVFTGLSYAVDLFEVDGFLERGFDLCDFEDWVARTHNPSRLTTRSFGLARLESGDEGGLELWFRWYDDFRAERDSTTSCH